MRKLCQLLCLSLNFAYGTSVAASPAKTSSQNSLVPVLNCAFSQSSIDCFHPRVRNIGPVGSSALSPLLHEATYIDSEPRMTRWVDRYWSARMGLKPPMRISHLCLCAPVPAGQVLSEPPPAEICLIC